MSGATSIRCHPPLANPFSRNVLVILHRLVALSLFAGLLALAPVAHPSPPDQTWIAGLYDNADFDDVIVLITSNLGAIQPSMVSSLCPVDSVVGLVSPVDTAAPVLSPPSSPSVRSEILLLDTTRRSQGSRFFFKLPMSGA